MRASRGSRTARRRRAKLGGRHRDHSSFWGLQKTAKPEEEKREKEEEEEEEEEESLFYRMAKKLGAVGFVGAVLVVLIASVYRAFAAEAVVTLTPSNFDAVVKPSDFIVVEFYAPWWCAAPLFRPRAGPMRRKRQEVDSLVFWRLPDQLAPRGGFAARAHGAAGGGRGWGAVRQPRPARVRARAGGRS